MNQTSFFKMNIPYTIGLLSKTKELLNHINSVLCIRNVFKRKKLKYTTKGLLDFSCRYSHKITAVNNNDSYNHGLNVTLLEYQLQALQWMIDEEKDKIGFHRHLYAHGRFSDDAPFAYSTVFQHLIINESIPIAHGGFLCQEMGLGKTIIALALINCNKPEQTSKRRLKMDPITKKYESRATLIIAPTSLVGQWEKECDEKTRRKLRYKTYYGGDRSREVADYVDTDIVLTTYTIIGGESGDNLKKHALHRIKWHRIILDESHKMKNSNTVRSKSILKLCSANRWCLTGTPFGTTICDILNQLKFIGISSEHLNRLNLSAIHRQKLFDGNGSFGNMEICIPLMYIMKKLVMRHKKSQKFNKKPIVNMPDKEENVIFIEFSAEERIFYDKLYESAKQKYFWFKAMGNVGRGSIQIRSSLFPSRQACSGHVYDKAQIENELELAKAQTLRMRNFVNMNTNKSEKELYAMAKDEAFNISDNGECPICFECPLEAPLQTPCRHIFCGDCIESILREKSECPICRKEVDVKSLKKPPSKVKESENEQKKEKDNDDCTNGFVDEKIIRFDSKLNAVMNELKRLKKEKPNDKSLIFTSFTRSLASICERLRETGLEYRTLIGSMTKNKRKQQLDDFSNDANVKVFVLTVQTGADGLTLTAANHVFMLEPPWNPALYRQAINRVHRLGQTKKVFVHSMIIKDSVEERIYNINQRKMNGFNHAQNKAIAGNISSDNDVKLQKHEISKLFE